jgi:AcrR family transcriptional regulator
MARTGRRRGGGDTLEAIRIAARRQFAEHGYEGTTIRGIAGEAGVDPALVMHFFGSKERLLLAGVEWPFDPDEAVPALLDGKRSEVGERLVRRSSPHGTTRAVAAQSWRYCKRRWRRRPPSGSSATF